MKKRSYADPSLWLDEKHWIVSINDRPPNDKDAKFARIIIEGILNQNRFVVEYQIEHEENKKIKTITRKIQDIYRLGYNQKYTISYIAIPKECMALDTHLEQLSELLKIQLLSSKEPVFTIKKNLIAWCLDQFESAKVTASLF